MKFAKHILSHDELVIIFGDEDTRGAGGNTTSQTQDIGPLGNS